MNEKAGKARKTGLWLAFEVGALWFTTHVGGGFALGTQEVQFFLRFGSTAFYFPVISMAILAAVFYFSWEFQRVYQIPDYASFIRTLFGRLGTLWMVFYDIAFSITIVLAAGATLAGFANALGGVLGGVTIPLWLGYILAAVVVYMIASYGLKVVLDSSAYMSLGIVAVIILLVLFRLPRVVSHLPSVPAENPFAPSFFQSAIWFMMAYAGFQVCSIGSYVNGGAVLKTHKQTVWAAICGFLLNASMLILMTLVLAGNYPDVLKDAAPTLTIVKGMSPIFSILYHLMVLLALITTAVSMIYATAKRWSAASAKWVKSGGRWADDKFRLRIWTIIWIVLVWAVSNIGIVNIVKKGYGTLAYLGWPILILPILIIAPRKIAQKNRELAKAKS
ncbi:MAG: hypothetical protein ABFD13_04825 [Candidatus Cryosericum sp.]